MLKMNLKDIGSNEVINNAAEIVQNEGVIAYPTDTIYGLGCNPFDQNAVERIYDIKGRDVTTPLIILLDSAKKLESWVDSIPEELGNLVKLWPERLTIIMDVIEDIPQYLTRGGSSLAFRIPKNEFCRDLVAACGGALTSTSVNRSGQKELLYPKEIEHEFFKEIDLLIESEVADQRSSTIVKYEKDQIIVLRQGDFELPEGFR